MSQLMNNMPMMPTMDEIHSAFDNYTEQFTLFAREHMDASKLNL